MEVDKTLLQTMIREFWAIDNNGLCHDVTIIALRKMGFSDKEIRHCISDLNILNNKDAEEVLRDAMDDTRHYYSDA